MKASVLWSLCVFCSGGISAYETVRRKAHTPSFRHDHGVDTLMPNLGPLVGVEYEMKFSCSEIFSSKPETPSWPPPCKPPGNLVKDFALGWRTDLVPYESCLQEKQNNGTGYVWTKQAIDDLVKGNPTECYSTSVCQEALSAWKHAVEGKRVIVFGSQSPWAEAMLLRFGAASVTTYEYMSIKSQHAQLHTITPAEAAVQHLAGLFGDFDVGFSFSSFEHDGLGRYGDPINPFGDFESVAKASCLIKPNGTFFLGLPVGPDKTVWNAHRIYGPVRLPLLLSGWRLLSSFGAYDFTSEKPDHTQPIFVLQNKRLGQ